MHRMGAHIHHARLRCESNITQSAKPIEKGTPQKKAPRHARRQQSEEAERQPSHIDCVGLREHVATSGETPGTDSSGVTMVNVSLLPREASLNTGHNGASCFPVSRSSIDLV